MLHGISASISKSAFAALALTMGVSGAVFAQDWEETVAAAAGQTVFFNAWGGDERINAYIAWAGDRVREDFGVTVQHVKLADTAEAVNRVRLEQQANKTTGGSIDLIWINGENFATMKSEGLLFGPWAEHLPAFAGVDVEGKPTTVLDFQTPTEGFEAPWGMAQFNVIVDGALAPDFPTALSDLTDWAAQNPGRFTYPQPPNFLGTTFLKQATLALSDNPNALYAPVDVADFAAVTAPVWAFLDQLHPNLWQRGQNFPVSGPAAQQLLSDAETAATLSFFPLEGPALVAAETFVEATVVQGFDGGSIGNTHFVAIPFNSSAAAGAQVFANFLMTPEAQIRKQSLAAWGDATVLDESRLSAAEQSALLEATNGLSVSVGSVLPEPHPSWTSALEAAWLQRYGS
ncbi:MAG: ABC transporter substrate-binding protein [Alphaproteobacteria bacterium]|jgi:putative thiamine transport system substrate-binding protein|nr:ABC transporter substrate-binding protein [Alphaproteobacteria bacterium]